MMMTNKTPMTLLLLGGSLIALLGCNDDPPALDSGTKDLTVTHDINVADQEAPADMVTIPDQPVGPSCQETEDCAADHYCERGEGCGMMDVPGVCVERPTDCTEEINLTCGCDGMTHDNPCLAHAAGASVAYLGECGKEVCATDETCTAMGWWCDGGICVECSNAGLSCDLACPGGGGQAWWLYQRNGCNPCECAPENECISDAECDSGETCYAGAFCWDWCPPGDPSCCYGNRCSADGCTGESPVGCWTRGCPLGQICEDSGCESSSCICDGNSWGCTADCNGGTCVPL